MRQTYPYRIKNTHLFLQDEVAHLDDLTELEDPQLFTLEPLPSRSYEKDNDTWFDLTIEMNLDLEIIQRNGYTILDLLSDVGGILEISSIVITYFLAFWNYNYFENFLVTRLFKLEKENLDEEKKKQLN